MEFKNGILYIFFCNSKKNSREFQNRSCRSCNNYSPLESGPVIRKGVEKKLNLVVVLFPLDIFSKKFLIMKLKQSANEILLLKIIYRKTFTECKWKLKIIVTFMKNLKVQQSSWARGDSMARILSLPNLIVEHWIRRLWCFEWSVWIVASMWLCINKQR